MTRPFIRIHNVELNEIIDREMNDEEFAIYQADQAASTLEKTKAQEAAAKKAAAEAKLAALGLTADDLKALGLA
jgi:hypothetical protein